MSENCPSFGAFKIAIGVHYVGGGVFGRGVVGVVWVVGVFVLSFFV